MRKCEMLVAQSCLTPAIPRTVARQAPLSMRFSRQEYRSGLPFPSPGDLPHPGIKPSPLMSPALAGGFFNTELSGKPQQGMVPNVSGAEQGKLWAGGFCSSLSVLEVLTCRPIMEVGNVEGRWLLGGEPWRRMGGQKWGSCRTRRGCDLTLWTWTGHSPTS